MITSKELEVFINKSRGYSGELLLKLQLELL